MKILRIFLANMKYRTMYGSRTQVCACPKRGFCVAVAQTKGILHISFSTGSSVNINSAGAMSALEEESFPTLNHRENLETIDNNHTSFRLQYV
jgi:hypothetical protein